MKLISKTIEASGHAIVLVWAITAIYSHWNGWPLDASALYFSAYFFDLGQTGLVYLPDPVFFMETPPAEWVSLAVSQGETGRDFAPYVYPPLWAALLAPVVKYLTATEFFNLILLVNVAATAGSIYLSYGLLRKQNIGFALWALLSVAFVNLSLIGGLAIELGQPQIFVIFLILLAFRALLSGRSQFAGAILAGAAAIKIAPGYLVIIFIMEKRWRALFAFVTTSAALAGLSILLAGTDLHGEFLLRLQDLSSKVLISRINITLDSVLLQISNWVMDAPAWGESLSWIQEKPGWLLWIKLPVLVGGLFSAYVTTRQLTVGKRIWFRLHLVYLITLITSPLAWTHYLYLSILLLPGLLSIASARFASLYMASFLIVFSNAVYIQLLNVRYAGNIILFSGFAMVVFLIVSLMRLAVQQDQQSASK